MKFSTVIAVMGSADALALNQMAEIYKQVYQRPANDLFTALGEQDNATALGNATDNATSFAQDNATALGNSTNATAFGNATDNATSFAQGNSTNATAFGNATNNATAFAQGNSTNAT